MDTGVTTSGLAGGCECHRSYNGINFVSLAQEERGGLALVNGIVYVSYSGYVGDCGNYHGWVVGVDINNPLTSRPGRQQQLAAEFGDTAVLLAMALTCS